MSQLVRNNTGVLIPRGRAVYCNGSAGELLQVALARADSTATMPAIGITLEAIGDKTEGRLGSQADLLPGVDTSAWTLGADLFVSAVTAGALTNVAPTSPNQVQNLGHVVRVGVEGAIGLIVRPPDALAVGQAAGGELAGNYPNPTVAAVHSGSAHYANPVPAHEAAADPHTGYQRESEKGVASGYASLDAGTLVPDAQIPGGITRDSEHGGFSPTGHHAQAHTLSGTDHTGALVEAQTPLTTKGDLMVSDGTLLQRVPVGADTQVLTADAAQANGVKWAAAGGGGGGAWTTAVKTADQTNNTITLVDDTALQFTPLANTQYTIRLRAQLLTNATADSKYRMVHTGTTTRVRRRIRRTATTDIAQTIELKTAFDAADVVLSTTGLNPWVEEEIILQVGATPGVVKFQWAQVTANAGPTQCLEGSYLEYAVA